MKRLMILVLPILLTACAQDVLNTKPEVRIDPDKVKASKATPLAIDDPMNGYSVVVPVGETFEVSFQRFEASGYAPSRWFGPVREGGVERIDIRFDQPSDSVSAYRTVFTYKRVSEDPAELIFSEADRVRTYQTVRVNVISE